MSIPSYDVIIIGGSYAGLSAAMCLGRSLRKTLVIDSGKPCNRQTPYSHNYLTQDGVEPAKIAATARKQVLKYPDVHFNQAVVVDIEKTATGFKVFTLFNEIYQANKIIFASGITDNMPNIPGFAACWGISILHCPFCHGYEVRHKKTGIFANADTAFEIAKLISNWTDQLIIFTNGVAHFNDEQLSKLHSKNISIDQRAVKAFNHTNGKIKHILFADDQIESIDAIYARPSFEQNSNIPENMGCRLTEHGHIQVDMWQQTSIDGVYACGDAASPMRSVINAVQSGNLAAVAILKSLVDTEF